MSYLNAASYRFVRFEEERLPELREALLARSRAAELCGTILLATEGVNVNVAGTPKSVEGFRAELPAIDRRLGDLDWKDSVSGDPPYRRMLVKIKKEIIAFGVDHIRPDERTAERISAKELATWLDAGRDVLLLDTRNRYETRLGKLRDARELDIDTFRSFPEATSRLGAVPPETPIVTYCTGGIRCEKASALLLERGYRNVYQLDGGILRYFEECGASHYDGECFVYDRRVALDPELGETATVQCFACHHPVTAEEQRLPSYVPDESCPHCVDGKPSKKTLGSGRP